MTLSLAMQPTCNCRNYREGARQAKGERHVPTNAHACCNSCGMSVEACSTTTAVALACSYCHCCAASMLLSTLMCLRMAL